MHALEGKVALVAGATRGAGRAIACALGEAGATVYVTGRSVRGASAMEGRPESIEETAELIQRRGGRAHWVQVDHTQESEVEALCARIGHEQEGLDVLVDGVWGGDALTQWGVPFWELSMSQGRQLFQRAVESHWITCRHATPLLLARGSGLLVEVTDGDALFYRGNLFYDLAKTSVIRLAYAMAQELRSSAVTALAVTPGMLRSEAVLAHFGVDEEHWRDAIEQDPHFAHSESPALLARGIVALACDPQVRERAGRVWASWTLAREYGLEDADGRRPDWGAHIRATGEELMQRGAPYDPLERMILEQHASRGDFDPEWAQDAARIRALLD